MDILDIDEVLKDDSFCLMEADSEQDDINDILQQWRQNGCNGSDARVDTRTFTRPKRRTAQNLDHSFILAGKSPAENLNSTIQLKVGGLVTSQMQKSFLQDTSPPSSISSSMDASSIDRMGNSLITSGDFTNVSFFKTTDADDVLSGAQIAGYSFDDVIRDRKVLESLSLSGDSAIIKDCNIAQIDEITYLSKTNSGNSTMQNSTESMASGRNETYTMLNQTAISGGGVTGPEELHTKNCLNQTYENTTNLPQDDLICNTTMSLIDSTHIVNRTCPATGENINATFDKMHIEEPPPNETFLKAAEANIDNNTLTLMNRTYYKEQDGNKTFDLFESPVSTVRGRDNYFESPLSSKLAQGRSNATVHSTPHRNLPLVVRSSSVVSQSPVNDIIQDANISPIVPASKNKALDHEFLLDNETKPYSDRSIDQLEKYLESMSDKFPSVQEQIENFKVENPLQDENPTKLVVGLESNIELLADEKNEEEFDDMLEELGRSHCMEESMKMRQSIDNIKKKHALSSVHERVQELTAKASESSVEINRFLSDSTCISSLSSSGSSERLLSRRSRLYDDVQVTKTSSENVNKTINVEDSKNGIAKTDDSIAGSSCTVECKTDQKTSPEETVGKLENENKFIREPKSRHERNRDPERFKTIRIFKRPTDNEIVVPCIDGEIEDSEKCIGQDQNVDTTNNTQVVERSINSTPPVFNNNKSEIEPNVMYQTYKKPKTLMKPSTIIEHTNIQAAASREIAKPRSLSRPKYFSGIARRDPDLFGDAIPKASSASDIHKTYNPGMSSNGCMNGTTSGMMKLNSYTGTIFTKTPQTNDLKSPMGTKAKSFTNLAGTGSVPFTVYPTNRLSIAKPNSQPSLIAPTGSGNMFNNKEKIERSHLLTRPTTAKRQLDDGVEKDEKNSFKVPPSVANLRIPNSRRTGLARPSSGYYGQTAVKSDPDIQTGRYSSNNSLSSSSSRGSVQDCHQPSKYTNGYRCEESTGNEELHRNSTGNVQIEQMRRMASARTSIPKPSGLKPPSTVRRSGLPRPSSIVRR